MNEQIDIAVFEDHPLLAAGLKAQLEQDHLLRLVWSTGDFKAFTQSLVAQPVGLLIADVIAPGVLARAGTRPAPRGSVRGLRSSCR